MPSAPTPPLRRTLRALRPPLVAAALLLASATAASAQQPAAPPEAPTIGPAAGAAVGAPVVLGGDTLFFVPTRVGSFSAAERAAAVRRRLEEIASRPFGRDEPVRVVHREAESDVLVGERVILTVTAADAAALGLSREVVARRFAEAVISGLRQQSFAARLRVIGVGALFALLVTLATAAAIRVLNRVFPRMYAALEAGRTSWLPTLRIQKLELLSASQLADALLWLAKMLRVALLALLLYLAVPTILSFFPWTEGYADRLFDYILTPFAMVWAGLVRYIPNVFVIGAIVLVAWYLLKLIRLFFVGVARGSIVLGGFYPEWAIPTYKIVRFGVILLSLVAAWPYVPGSSTPAFQGIGVLLGLVISFGSASAIGNAVAGIVLTYMRPFRVGDRVKIADTVGDVVEKGLLITRVRTIKNVDVTIPNSLVLGSHITNYSSSAKTTGLVLNTTVTIGYDAPWRRVHELLTSAARATPGILAEPAPFVLQTSLDDFYVSYELNAFTDQPNAMSSTYSLLHANIQDRFNEAGVEIMSPHYRAARDGNQSTIPAEHLPPDYVPPSFRVASPEGVRDGS